MKPRNTALVEALHDLLGLGESEAIALAVELGCTVIEVVAIAFCEVEGEWEDMFKDEVRRVIEEQGVKVCREGLDVGILTPSRMARLAGEAGAHLLVL